LSAEPAREGWRRMLSIPVRSRRIGLDVPKRVCNPAVMGHTMHPTMLPDSQALQASGWRAASFAISTPQGRLDVDGIVRSPFGIDPRSIDEEGTRGWSVTHLPSGLAVVRQIKVLAVALAFVDRISALTDWTVQQISATPDLRAQVQTALDQAYDDFYSGRLPPVPEDTSSAS
jgi:hypothetical protein